MSNLGKRLCTAGVIIPVLVLFIFFLPGWMIFIPGGLMIVIGGLETMEMIGRSKSGIQYGFASAIIITYCGFTFAGFALGNEDIAQNWLSITGITVISILIISLLFFKPVETAGNRLAGTIVAIFYPGILLTILLIMHNTLPEGKWWTFLTLSAAFVSDTGAYFAGRGFGRHKLAPDLSPKKTIEGVAGGITGAMLTTFFAHFVFLKTITLVDAILLGVIAATADSIGDLVESMIKRSSGIKDSGTFFPGHGGVMDRIDGLLFVIPAFYVYATLKF